MSTLELETAKQIADQKTEKFEDALERLETAVEAKAQQIGGIIDTVQQTVEIPRRLGESIAITTERLTDQGIVLANQALEESKRLCAIALEKADPAIQHVKRNRVAYAYAAGTLAVGFGIAAIVRSGSSATPHRTKGRKSHPKQ